MQRRQGDSQSGVVRGVAEPEFKLTMRVNEFCHASGLCRDKVFELLNSGAIDSFRCGKLRLVSVESYRRWMAEQIRRDKMDRGMEKSYLSSSERGNLRRIVDPSSAYIRSRSVWIRRYVKEFHASLGAQQSGWVALGLV